MLFETNPELIKEYSKENIDSESISKLSIFSQKSERSKSLNPLVDVDPIVFVSDFLIVRKMEMCARFCIPYRKMRENLDDLIKSHEPSNLVKARELFEQFEQKLILGMTDFEKRMYGDPKTDKEMNDMALKISALLRNNLDDTGRHILTLIYRRSMTISQSEEEN